MTLDYRKVLLASFISEDQALAFFFSELTSHYIPNKNQ